MRIKILLFFLCLLSFAIVPLVSALPVENHQEGSWSGSGTYPVYIDSNTNQVSSAINSFDFPFQTLNNCTGIEANFTISNLFGYRTGWALSGVKRFWVALDLTDNVTHAFNKFYIAHESGLIVQTSQIKVGSNEQQPYTNFFGGAFDSSSNVTDLDYSMQLLRLNDTVVAVYLFQLNAKISDVGLNNIYTNMVWNETFTVPVSFWSVARFHAYIACSGSGLANVTFTGLDVKTIVPYEKSSYGTPYTGLKGGLWDFIFAVSNTLMQIGTFFAGLAVGIVPLLPVIFLGYMADAIVSSIQESSIQPIGKAFRFMLESIYGAFQTIAAAVGALWPF